MNGQQRPQHGQADRTACNETRSTRLHYQLRCLLPVGHGDEHRWTPELLAHEPVDEAATG